MPTDYSEQQNTVSWIGVACVEPLPNSSHSAAGLVGGYGFIACRAANIVECIQRTSDALSAEGTRLSGYKWLTRLDLYESQLNEYQARLVDQLETHPVQYQIFDWYGTAH